MEGCFQLKGRLTWKLKSFCVRGAVGLKKIQEEEKAPTNFLGLRAWWFLAILSMCFSFFFFKKKKIKIKNMVFSWFSWLGFPLIPLQVKLEQEI